MEIKVPALASLAAPAGTDGYVLTGSGEDGNTHHPNGHFGTAASNTGLREIASEYRTHGVSPTPIPEWSTKRPEASVQRSEPRMGWKVRHHAKLPGRTTAELASRRLSRRTSSRYQR